MNTREGLYSFWQCKVYADIHGVLWIGGAKQQTGSR